MGGVLEEKLAIVFSLKENCVERKYREACKSLDAYDEACKNKATRAMALEALKRLVEEATGDMRMRASFILGDRLRKSDTAWLPWLRERLRNEREGYGCAEALLRVAGEKAYAEVAEMVMDESVDMDTRHATLGALSEHSKHDFRRGMPLFKDLKPEHFPLARLRAWVDSGCAPYQPGSVPVPVEEMATLGFALPGEYETFLRDYPVEVNFETEENTWCLFLAHELPAQARHYKPDLPAGWLPIGEGGSGDVLCLLENSSLMVYHHDDGTTDEWAKSFSGWLRRAKKT